MPVINAVRNVVNFLAAPQYLVTIALLLLVLAIRWKPLWSKKGGIVLGISGVLFFALSYLDPNFNKVATLPDNVPIVGMIFLVGFFFWYAMHQAYENDRRVGAGLATIEGQDSAQKVFSWPDLVYVELICLVVVMAVMIIWSIYLKAPLEEPANPTDSPNPAKAPWYFLGLQEMLVYFDPWIAGVVMPTLIIIGLMVIPYIDTNPLGSGYYTWKQRRFAISTFLFGFIILWVSMIIIGTFIRGPGWQWFWPGQTWDHNRLIYEVNRDLPDLFGIASNLGKAIFGAVVVGGFFAVGGFLINAFFRRSNPRDYKRMSLLQYSIMVVFVLTMVALPLKMMLRLLWHIKYVWITPWFNI